MTNLATVLFFQISLLMYHQVTTLVDFFPFNGVANYTMKERFAEAGANAVLMGMGPIGYALHVRGLMIFGVVYYFVLFGIEIVLWWIPYIFIPTGIWRTIYNRLLAAGASDFGNGDTLNRWLVVHA